MGSNCIYQVGIHVYQQVWNCTCDWNTDQAKIDKVGAKSPVVQEQLSAVRIIQTGRFIHVGRKGWREREIEREKEREGEREKKKTYQTWCSIITKYSANLLYFAVLRGLVNLEVFLSLNSLPSLSNTSSYMAASLNTGWGMSWRGVPLKREERGERGGGMDGEGGR